MLWIGMAGITMFFAGLTSAFIVRKAEGNWQLFEFPDWFLYSTIVIVLSSVLLWVAKRQLKKEKPFSVYVLLALILGLCFTYTQIQGWKELVEQGIYLTGEGSNVSGSFLFVITFAHLVHLIGGLIALLVTTIKSRLGRYTKENHLGLELTSIYWHFLDFLWLYLFFFMQYL